MPEGNLQAGGAETDGLPGEKSEFCTVLLHPEDARKVRSVLDFGVAKGKKGFLSKKKEQGAGLMEPVARRSWWVWGDGPRQQSVGNHPSWENHRLPCHRFCDRDRDSKMALKKGESCPTHYRTPKGYRPGVAP